MADRMNSDLDELLSSAMKASRAMLRRLRREALGTPKQPVTVESAAFRAGQSFESLVVSAMVAGHLSGARRVIDMASPKLRKSHRFNLDDLVDDLRKLLDLSNVTVQQVQEIYGSEARVAALEATDNLSQALRETANEAIEDGLTTHEARLAMSAAIERQGFDAVNPWRIETVFRTQQALSYSAGQGAQARDPLIDDILWGYEYVTVGDDRVRPSHVAMDGIKLGKDDPAWQTITPPNGWNCRCQRVMVFEEQEPVPPPDSVEVDGIDVRPVPDAGFAFNPGDVFGFVRANVR